MIDGLIAGKVYGKPTERVSRNGNQFVTAKVRVPTAADDVIFANVIAFAPAVMAALLALDDGDAVAIAGTIKPDVWTPHDGDPRPQLDVRAHAVLTAYHVKRKRRVMRDADVAPPRQAPFDDDLEGVGT